MTDWADTMAGLLRARGPALRRYAVLLSGSEHEADDVLQEALLRVFAGRGYKVGPEALEAYLYRTMAKARRRPSPRWWQWSRSGPAETEGRRRWRLRRARPGRR
ncbi:MAG: hypothetical protein AUG49_18260 [Catenulispora sp. 13_1_20CM_3_70_7]|nr:MAG: hypothetical protein AUG49_18260 [Catenulispora sp. 13_1_20CM_3_70_7]